MSDQKPTKESIKNSCEDFANKKEQEAKEFCSITCEIAKKASSTAKKQSETLKKMLKKLSDEIND